MIRNSIWSAAVGLAAACVLLLVLTARMDRYFADLATWRDDSRQLPEGPQVADLFNEAVDAGAVRWNAQIGQVELRRDVPVPPDLEDALFRMREAGATIDLAVQRTRYVGGYVAIRAHFPDCPAQCRTELNWDLSGFSDGLVGLAQVASVTRTQGVPAPLPRLFFPLSREAGSGYVPWKSFATQSPLILRSDTTQMDVVDIIGRLVHPPSGWRIEALWCFDQGQVIVSCNPADDPVAVRLRRVEELGETLVSFSVHPVRLVPQEGVAGRSYLTDRILLTCEQAGKCQPEWQAVTTAIPYARRGSEPTIEEEPDIELQYSGAQRILGDLVEIGPDGLLASEKARSLGVGAYFGDTWPSPGSILAEAVHLSDRASVSFSVDPQIQTIVRSVVDSAADNAPDGLFSGLRARFPAAGPQVSFVVLDLRQDQTIGAVLASYGRPERQVSRSDWDTRASLFDRSAPLPPGAAGWTGANWRHTPGSTWKLMTALSLIDMIASGRLAANDMIGLQQAMLGIDASRAGTILGPAALSGAAGVCTPTRIGAPVRGAPSLDGCGAGYFPPIRDSGRPGPLHGRPGKLYGLEEAIAKSSNIWFVSMLMSAERLHAARYGDPGSGRTFGMEATLERMGFTQPRPLDSNLGLRLLNRDAARIEALEQRADMQALSSSSYGQRVWAGPMITAQIAGSIAVNRNIQPGLFVPLQPPARLYSAQAALPLLDELRRGMRSVVSNSDVGPGFGRGTAVSAFAARAPGLAPRVAGKTGTAQRDSGLDRISTFAGWMDDTEGRPLIAIGCSSTVLGQRSGTRVRVPQLCAHMSAEVLRRIAMTEAFQ